jgi:glycosyltransferase involved in cell wall biosynthesis
VLDALRVALPAAALLVVDDSSTDTTAAVAIEHGARVAPHPIHLGYGAALLTGYTAAIRAGFTRCVQLDADGQHDPAFAPALLEPLRRGVADVVLGSRFLGGPVRLPLVRRTGTASLRALARAMAGLRITDPTSGYRALTASAMSYLIEWPLPDDYPDLDVLIAMHRAGIRVTEVPVPSIARRGGTSMHGGIRAVYYAYKVGLSSVIATRRHPREGRSVRA